MPKFEVTDPRGKRYEVEGPEGATSEQALFQVQEFAKADWWKTLKSIPGTTLGIAEKAVGGILRNIGETDYESAIAAERGGGPLRGDPDFKPNVGMQTMGAELAGLGEEQIKESHPGDMTFWQRAVQSGVSSAIVQVPALAASIATRSPVPAMATAGAMTFGDTYAEARSKGIESGRASIHAGIDMTAEAALELLPAQFLVDNAGGPVLKLLTGTLIREVPTEVLTTAIQGANAKISTRPDMTWQEYGQDLLDTVGATMVSAPILAGTAAVMRTGREEEKPAAPGQGEVNKTLTPPFDQPTTIPDSGTKSQLDAMIASIDADLITDEQVAEAQAAIKIYDEKMKQKALPNAQMSWSAVATAPQTIEDIGELGASKKQAANAQNYANPNIGDRLQFPISFGPEGTVGQTLQQIEPQPATYVIGQPSSDRPPEMLQAMGQTLEDWRKKYMPEATIVLSNEQLFSDSALGWHYTAGNNQHIIVPGVLRNATRGLGAFNVNTQAGVFYNLTHEFGHALFLQTFIKGVAPGTVTSLRADSSAGLVSEAVLQQLPEEQRAVVQEYNAVKAKVLNNSMSAQEFVDTWFSPAKLGRKTLLEDLGVAPTDNAMAVVKAVVRRAVDKANTADKKKILQDKLTKDFLSLEEYLAEQTARHAYKQNWDKTTPLGRFFKNALDSLRKFFIGAKKEGQIAPGTAFAEWLDGLSKSDRPLNEGKRVADGRKKGKAVVAKKPATTKTPGKKKPAVKVSKVQHNVETSTDQEKRDQAMRLLTNLELSGAIPDEVARNLYDLIERNDFGGFFEEFAKHAPKNVKFQLDEEKMNLDFVSSWRGNSVLKAGISEAEATSPSVLADAQKEWQEKQFDSEYFKAWFGDWRNDPEAASKIRRGSIIQNPRSLFGFGAVDISTMAEFHVSNAGFGYEPLVVFHATSAGKIMGTDPKRNRQAFERFSRGDIGFHFGTVRAAHSRIGIEPSTGLSDTGATSALHTEAYIIPTVLNIRKPLYIGPEDTAIWARPTYALSWFERYQLISRETMLRYFNTASENEEQMNMYSMNSYEANAPVRMALLDSGYDGIIYENTVEGDISFVALQPNQVKAVLGSRTFSRSDNMHMETDLDAATPEGASGGRLLKNIKNFLNDAGPLRRALRAVQHASFYLLELQQLAHLNPDISELSYMNEENTNYNRRKSSLMAPSDAVVDEWADLGKENDAKVSNFLFDEREGGKLWFDVVREGNSYKYALNAKTVEELAKRGVDLTTPEGESIAKLILDAKNALMHQLNALEGALTVAIQNRYSGGGPEVLKAHIIPLKRRMQDLRKVPFFPQGRFGNYVVTVEKERQGAPGYEVVYREAFERRSDWEAAAKTAQAKAAPDERVQNWELTDQEYVLMALPTDFVDLAVSELGLSPEQVERLLQILQPVKQEKAFRRYDESRLGLKGYSTDAMRSFANFTWHNANMIAKLEYRSKFGQAIQGVQLRLRKAQYGGPEMLEQVERLGRIETYMKRTRDYVMAPPYEAQAIRAVVSVAYLGLNVKTALINFYGLVTTWSDLTTRYGQIEGNTRFLRAMKQGMQSLKLTDLNDRREGSYLPPETQAALDRAIEDGVLSQSYAYHLAGMANGGNLWRLPAKREVGKYFQKSVDAAMWPFRLMELATRRISFLAEFEAASKEENLGMSDPYTTAVTRTNKLQNDYSTGNRAPFLRGIKTQPGNPLAKILEPALPLATVFMTFTQHMAFHSYGGYELGERRLAKELGQTPRGLFGSYTIKIWLATLLLAGYEGLPGAENLLDFIEITWRKLGGRKPVRQELRELVQAVDGDPQLWARGLGHNVAGFDVSRSLGLGRIFPGTDVLAHPRDNVAETVGTLALDLAGPTGAFVKFGLDALFSNKPPAETFQRMPGGLGNIWSAYQWSQKGVRSPSGALVTHDLETGKLRDLTAGEIAGKSLGFNPTIVSQNREVMFAQYDRKIYWQTRRDILLDDYWRAHWQKDREAQADVRKSVSDFNASIPASYKDLRVTGADIARSTQARERIKRFEEQQSTPQRRYRSLYKDVKGSFNEPNP